LASNTPPENPNPWFALTKLARMSESQRRRALRSHREAGFGAGDPYVELREELDTELGRLAELELRAEILTDGHDEQEIRAIAPFSKLVQNPSGYSPSFAHYLNAYLYFKIRFAAGRLGPVCNASLVTSEWNERAIGLPPPPQCECIASEELRRGMERFQSLQITPNAKEALRFLDDYVHEPNETKKFDLWLRGLLPRPPDEQRFVTLAQGLYDWALNRYRFYVGLEMGRGNDQEIDRGLEHAESWEEGHWHASNPLAARCGVVDLYWLARILRAEVSPRGVVRYVDRSWLYYLPILTSQLPQVQKYRILHIEEVLRSVFDFACDLIQNAVEMAEYGEHKTVEPTNYPDRPRTTSDWRAAYDDELDDIANQRRERGYGDAGLGAC
jgi:hypothetical protein